MPQPSDCDPCQQPFDQAPSDPAGFVEPNEPGGGPDGSGDLPVIPPDVGPGPTATGLELDTSEPDYAGLYPRQDLTSFMKWCRTLPAFSAINGILMTILTNHFANAKNIINPTLRPYTWDTTASSPLTITTEEDWEAESINRKPSLILSRQAVVVDKVAIGDRKQSGRIDGIVEYAVLMKGSHVIKCKHVAGRPTDDLAFETAALLIRACPFIRAFLGLTEMRVTYIGGKEQVDKDSDLTYFVPVTVPWAFWYIFKTTAVAPTIDSIDLAFFQ